MSSRPAGVPQNHRAAPTEGGRPHHLASVVHHFLSDVEPEKTSNGQAPARLVISGYACQDLVALTGRVLGTSDAESGMVVLDEKSLAHVEGLIPHGGADLVRPADLVWCLAVPMASSLAGAQLLGRWIRCLECRRVDILLADEAGGRGEKDLGTLRRLTGLVAPGVPVGITVAGPGRWEGACADLARRLGHPAESGSP